MHPQLIGLRRRRLGDQPPPEIHRRPQLLPTNCLFISINIDLAQDEMRIRQRRPARPLPPPNMGWDEVLEELDELVRVDQVVVVRVVPREERIQFIVEGRLRRDLVDAK